MKRRDALQALPALALAAAGPRAQAQAVPTPPGQAVPWPAGLTLLDGQAWKPAPGQAVIAVVWSTTCPFCQRHNVHVEKLHRALAGRAATVLGIARESDADVVRQHMARRGWTFPVTLDWREAMAVLTRRQLTPQTITVDRQGRLKQVIPGEMTEDDVMQLAALANPTGPG